MSNMAFDAPQALEEYVGTDDAHIRRIMDRLSDICPPMVYPPVGDFDNPRLPFQAGAWTLGSLTAPDGGKQADFSSAAEHGKYYIGSDWPSADMAPQAILWVPPEWPEVRFQASGDRTGLSRVPTRNQGADDDVLFPESPQLLTSQNPQHPGRFSYARTGSAINPWTVIVWGNKRQDTKLLAYWLASCAHDCERSQAERTGSGFTVTRGGWYRDKAQDRGLMFAMTVELVDFVVRSQFDDARSRSNSGDESLLPPQGSATPPASIVDGQQPSDADQATPSISPEPREQNIPNYGDGCAESDDGEIFEGTGRWRRGFKP